jgi:hypothetical protein
LKTNPLIEIVRFCVRQWYILLLVIPALVGFTILHEAAHALAVIVQGGNVTEFTFMPGGGQWGHIRYDFPDQNYSAFAISMAPYVMWTCVSLVAVMLSGWRRRYPFWLGAFVFVWLYAAPLADIANTAIPYLAGKNNDFASAFGAPTVAAGAAVGAFGGVAVLVGYWVQRRLYGDYALSGVAYLILGGGCLLMFGVL